MRTKMHGPENASSCRKALPDAHNVYAGKTQLCMLAAAACAARGEHSIYLDTTASCSPSRLSAMCQHPEGQPPVPHPAPPELNLLLPL